VRGAAVVAVAARVVDGPAARDEVAGGADVGAAPDAVVVVADAPSDPPAVSSRPQPAVTSTSATASAPATARPCFPIRRIRTIVAHRWA
jgi:hypothetical protein